MTVGADGHARLGGDDLAEAGVAVEHSRDVGECLLHRRVVDRGGVGVNDDLHCCRGVAAEMLLGEFAYLDGFGSVGLPAGPGQRRKHRWCS